MSSPHVAAAAASATFYHPHASTPSSANDLQHHYYYTTTPHTPFPADSDCTLYDARTPDVTSILGYLPPAGAERMNGFDDYYTPVSLPPTYDGRQDSVVSAAASVAFAPSAHDWQSMYQSTMSGPVATAHRPLKRARTHQRTPSASTVASNGPASPYNTNTSYPLIANTDYSPNSPAYYSSDQASFSRNHLLTPQQTPTDATFAGSGYIPGQIAHAPNAHQAMKGFPVDHHMSDDLALPDFYQSSRHSMSSGRRSPATPQSAAGDVYDSRTVPMQQNDYRQPNANVQLYRTESSQAYQDELYNPSNIQPTSYAQPKRNPNYLSPHHNLVSERLQTANLARSVSPTSAVSRERSPFRDGSPLAPTADWKTAGSVRTAAGMRQRQKEEAEQAEYARVLPTLRREPTKTISPKDAVLEYHENDQPPLFQEQLPAGYRSFGNATGNWATNFTGHTDPNYSQTSATPTEAQELAAFRATSNDAWEANLGYMNLPPQHQEQSQIPAPSFQSNVYAPPRMNYTESTPEFPAQLTSMESSVSEGGPPLSSQNSFNGVGSTVSRPADTRANTGTYTCTYHGCTERFNTHLDLQKHKRDFHRSQQQPTQQQQQQHHHQQAQRESTSTPSAADSASPRSTESPAPSGSGLTSAAILARNSQAGPHKCTRINPSTNKPCNTIFSRPYDLTRHEDTIHNNRKTKVKCPYCREEKSFSRNDALTRHMRVVHPDIEAYGKRARRGE